MVNACKTKPIDLNSLFLKKFEEDEPELYSKIIGFKELFCLDEITDGRYSISFLMDIFSAFENGGINIGAVMHELKHLEGKTPESKTKAPTEFKRTPLKGLWHKHYYDTSIPGLVHNIKNALNNYSIPYFEEKILEAKESGEERFMSAEDISLIVNDVVTGNLQRRSEDNKITGEWFIYAIQDNVKYYLCLAKHDDGDDSIRKKIDSSCIYEFPFLKDILPSVS